MRQAQEHVIYLDLLMPFQDCLQQDIRLSMHEEIQFTPGRMMADLEDILIMDACCRTVSWKKLLS